MTSQVLPKRRCLSCHAQEVVEQNLPMFPPGWTCPSCGTRVPEKDGIPLFAPALADKISGMDPANFEGLSKVEMDHFWFVPRNRLLVGLAKKYFPEARSFLEVGCGNGAVLSAVAASRQWDMLVGAELHPSGLTFARQRLPPSTEFVQMDARHVPASSAFDLTGAFDVIEHIAEDEAVLTSLRQATRPGGGIIVAVPQHPWLWSAADDMAFHERRYRRGELEEKLRRNGFEVVFSTSYMTILLPLMALSRLTSRTGRNAERVNDELLPHPVINGLLKGALTAEVGLTLRGISWPAGGSRVVVGRKI